MKMKIIFLPIALIIMGLFSMIGCSGNQNNPNLRDVGLNEKAPEIEILQHASAELLESPPTPETLTIN